MNSKIKIGNTTLCSTYFVKKIYSCIELGELSQKYIGKWVL